MLGLWVGKNFFVARNYYVKKEKVKKRIFFYTRCVGIYQMLVKTIVSCLPIQTIL